MYSFTFCSSSALDWGGWTTPCHSRLTPIKQPYYPLYRRLGGPQGRSRLVLKFSSLPQLESRSVQPVASRCTDWAIPAITHLFKNAVIFTFSFSVGWNWGLTEPAIHLRMNNAWIHGTGGIIKDRTRSKYLETKLFQGRFVHHDSGEKTWDKRYGLTAQNLFRFFHDITQVLLLHAPDSTG
jgi:hypothetical protein